MFQEFIESLPTGWRIVVIVALLAVGVVMLVKFCDMFVDSACVIAKKMNISPMIIGLTIVAMGTSCPELAVSVSDSISVLVNGGDANIAIGNVVGSNICNILLVLGCSAIFTPIAVKKSVCKKEYPFLLGITVLCFIFTIFFGNTSFTGNYAILRWEAIILVLFIILYVWFLIKNARDEVKREPLVALKENLSVEIKDMKLSKAIIFVIIGIVGVAFGGEFVVTGAKGLSLMLGDFVGLDHNLTESLVGLTIVAVGTSLPELVTSIVAARKGQNELALGNVIGSNIFNILFVLGISGVVSPLYTGFQTIIDMVVMIVSAVIVFLFALKGQVSKKDGWVLIGLYVVFVGYLIIRTIA